MQYDQDAAIAILMAAVSALILTGLVGMIAVAFATVHDLWAGVIRRVRHRQKAEYRCAACVSITRHQNCVMASARESRGSRAAAEDGPVVLEG